MRVRARRAACPRATPLAALLVAACGQAPPQPASQPAVPRDGAKAPQAAAVDATQAAEQTAAATHKQCALQAEHQVEPAQRVRMRPIVRALCSEYASRGGLGVQLAVGWGTETPIIVVLGRRCRHKPEPIGPDTHFRIGSVTKVFVALAAASLVVDKQLTLDAPISTWVPELADSPAGATTLRALLSHRATLPELDPSDTEATGHDQWLARVAEGAVSAAEDAPRTAPEGSEEEGGRESYRNVHYALVGLVIERATLTAWQDVVDTRVLAALAVERIASRPEGLPAEDAACGHLGWLGPPMLPVHSERVWSRAAAWTRPAGAMVASAGALVRVLQALTHPSASGLPPAVVEMVTDPAASCLPADSACARRFDDDDRRHQGADAYALGLRRTYSPRGDAVLRFSGRTGDYAADIAARADGTVAVAVLSNDGLPYVATIAAAVW